MKLTDRQIQEKIERIDWYRQGGDIVPFFPAPAYRAAFLKFDGFNYYRGTENFGYFDKNRERKIVRVIISRQRQDRRYIDRLAGDWRRRKKEQNAAVIKILSSDWSLLTTKQFIGQYKRFFAERFRLWRLAILIEAFDPWSDYYLRRGLDKYRLAINPVDLATLTAPRQLSFSQREMYDRLRLALDYRHGKNISQRLKRHATKYHWLENSWARVKSLDDKYFHTLVQQTAGQSTGRIKNRIKELRRYPREQSRRVARLKRQYRLPRELTGLFYLFAAMSDWRDERKEQMMKMNVIAQRFLEEISQRSGISVSRLKYLETEEFTGLAAVKRLEKELARRPAGSLYYVSGRRDVHFLTGRTARRLKILLDLRINTGDLTGRPAYRGKVTGRVTVVMTVNDYPKMKQGNILVTPMTRPEHLPIIHKAAAIVTDEGGVTCHAAIVARELKIPCIIGTQSATSILNTGDRVLVDADKGIVKKV
ncbi:MAG: PEP-utilizing enzyme [Patescibacteria group bacterium]